MEIFFVITSERVKKLDIIIFSKNSYFLYEGGRNEVRKRVGGVQSTFLGTSGFSLKPERSEGFKEATSDQKRHFAHLRPFFRTELGQPEYRILFFQTTQAFPNPPPPGFGGTISRPLPSWPRPLNIATPTKHFSLILRRFYYIISHYSNMHGLWVWLWWGRVGGVSGGVQGGRSPPWWGFLRGEAP